MDERSDDDLLAATRAQPEAFAVFYRRHVDALLAYFVRSCLALRARHRLRLDVTLHSPASAAPPRRGTRSSPPT
jgi:hypothetical protein